MKCFMPVYALALALAVTSDMVQQVSATACAESDVCTATSPCVSVADGTQTPGPVTKPSALVCSTGKFAYIKSLKIVAPTSLTDTTSYGVYFTNDGATAATVATEKLAQKSTSGTPTPCDNSYTDIGKTSITGDVKAIVGCVASTPACALKYNATWACQPADSCALTTDNCPSCTAVPVPKATTVSSVTTAGTKVLTKASDFTPATCPGGKFAYLTSLTLGAVAPTTTDKIAVTFTGATGLTGTKVDTVCDGKWTDVGKTATLTEDVKVNVACSDSAADCAIKWVGVWACQSVDTPAPSTTAPNATTVTPTPTPTTTTKSGVAALAGANPVVVWGTALVAAVAGANFAAPL